MTKGVDSIFICSSLVFNATVSALYIATKLEDMPLLQVCGGIVISLVIPYIVTLLSYNIEKAGKKTIISNGLVLLLSFLGLLLDYVFRIPFKEILLIQREHMFLV